MQVTRRAFLKGGGVAMVGFGALPAFLARAIASTAMPHRKILVVLFQRGAADGLNVVVPFGEPEYYRLRPSIAIAQPKSGRNGSAIDLEGFFGLHPSLAPLEPLYRQGHLGIVHAAGSPDSTRSHFDAQDYMESGTPGRRSTADGWLNRHLQAAPVANASPFRAVAVNQKLPLTLRGSAPAVAFSDARQFRVMSPSKGTESGFESLYAQSADSLLASHGQETFEAIEMLRQANISGYRPRNGVAYPRSRFGQDLLQVAQLIKADIGLEAAFVESGGWDHHVNEGGSEGQLANLLGDLGQGLAAFHRDLGDRMQDVVVVTLSEFGRTARENGNRGTDHGHGNCMFVMGGPVAGGRVLGRWPGLNQEQLYEGRDLALTTDFRTVLGELIANHLENPHLNAAFPGFANDESSFLGLIRA
jgi:uncharacterized protein (DUF1501 family)